jgi:glycolate oxidase iron-sulfur subunit
MLVELADKYRDTGLAKEAETLLQACVICGQCEPVCPTFRLLNDGWDGPRGRIFLIKQMLEGKEPASTTLPPAFTLNTLAGRDINANVQLHLDRCLTCRSCEKSCPQGVRYGRLLDIGRELAEKAVPRPLKEKVIRYTVRSVISNQTGFAALLRMGQALRPVLPEKIRQRIPLRRSAGNWPLKAHSRTMLVWQGCVQPALAPDINAAAARVLDRFGIRLLPSGDGCCGALSQHMAEPAEARRFMHRNIDALWPHVESGLEAIVLTASGCGAFFREYGDLLKDDPQYRDKARRVSALVRDIAEVVAEEWKHDPSTLPEPGKPQRRIVFQSSCSLQHSQKLNGVVERLLKQAGFKLLPVGYSFMCCGAAGTYSILQPELAQSLRASKLKTLLSGKPEAIATANIGCLTHLAAVSPLPVNHWIELLDKELPQHFPQS